MIHIQTMYMTRIGDLMAPIWLEICIVKSNVLCDYNRVAWKIILIVFSFKARRLKHRQNNINIP